MPSPEINDDSRHPTILSTVVDLFKFKPKIVSEDNSHLIEIPPVSAYPYESDNNITVYGIVLPKDEKFKIEDMEQLLLMLSYTESPISFEIVATHTTIGERKTRNLFQFG